MEKVLYLKSCNTCKRILKEVTSFKEFESVDIKENPLLPHELDAIANRAGSYEAIFNKQARKYRELKLNLQNLTEKDFRRLILEDYTFVKRPLFIIGNNVFAGNSKSNVSRLIDFINVERGN